MKNLGIKPLHGCGTLHKVETTKFAPASDPPFPNLKQSKNRKT